MLNEFVSELPYFGLCLTGAVDVAALALYNKTKWAILNPLAFCLKGNKKPPFLGEVGVWSSLFNLDDLFFAILVARCHFWQFNL